MALTQVTTRGISKGVEIVLSSGLTGDPSLAWSGDESTGLYSSATGYTDFTTTGTTILSIGPNGINFPSGAATPFLFNGSPIVTFNSGSLNVASGKQFIVPQGSVSAPSIAYEGDTDTGVFSSGDGQIDFVSNGAVKLSVNASGLVLPTGSTGSSINITNSLRNIYVSANDTLATDSLTNNGRSLNRPFKSIERALLEAAVQSWQNGPGDESGEYGADLFEFFTIIVFPGEYTIDNRPGDATNANVLVNTSYTDATLMENIYRLNAVNGGVIVPRGTSLVGLDLRKTIIRPKYVPSPVDNSAQRSALFRVTGGCYFWQFTVKDTILGNNTYKSATSTYTGTGADVMPASHHKLTAFEYASYPDLDTYYTKIDKYSVLDDIVLQGNRFGDARDLIIANKKFIAEVAVSRMLTNFSSFSVPGGRVNCEDDIEDVLEAVGFNVAYGANSKVWDAANLYVNGGALQHLVGEETESIYAFNQARNIALEVINNVSVTVQVGDTSLTQVKDLTITADPTTSSNTDANSCANVKSAITNMFALVTNTITTPTSLASVTRTTPAVAPASEDYIQRIEENRIVGSLAQASTADTVASASPYIFNVSLRSVFGLNGLHADGSRATGFKSMVLAQYTGIGLQKDNRAFLGTNIAQGIVQTNSDGNEYRVDPDSVYRDDWRHFHIKASNDGFLQVVSVFAVGNADHFLAETGGDMSITNSNSNFGNVALKSVSHRPQSFTQDSGGFIIGVTPPRGIDSTKDNLVSMSEIDVGQTVAGYNALSNSNKGNYKRIYIKIGGVSELKESDIPEFYTTNSSDVVTKAELLVSGLDYNLGKRNYSDNSPEAVYAFLPATPTDATSKLFGARLRARDASIDPATSQNGTATKNDVRSFYAWEYSQTVGGEDLGRVCLLVDDNRAAGSSTITGIPQSFSVTQGGSNTYSDILTTTTILVDAKVSDSSGNDVANPTQSSPIKVNVTVDGTSKQITAVTIYNPNSNNLEAGSLFAVGNNLRLIDGVGTGLGTRGPGGAPIPVIQVGSITSETGVSFAAGNIKPIGYIPFSSIGTRYYPILDDTALTAQGAGYLSLLRRLTQRVDTNGDNQTSDGGADQFEFDANTSVNIYIKRISDNRSASGNGELVWRAIYKMPKGASGSQELKPPEPRFTLQLRDNAAVYPFTYDGSNNFPKSYYIYKVEPLIEYKYTDRDGYYMLTLLDGNIYTKSDNSTFGNTVEYGVQTTSGTGYTVADTTITGFGLSQNINYLYPETDLDNPKWNPRPSLSKYRDDVGNTLPVDDSLASHGYDRITQYSITSEGMRGFLNNILGGGSITANLTNELNLTTYFGASSVSETKMIEPYTVAGDNTYGKNKPIVTSFASNIPTFSDRNILFGSNVTSSATAGVPVNLHRPSILRASGHTWEYVGYGPGNYSTGLPRFQTKVLSLQQQVNAQQIESSGGFVASSGTNSNGDFFIGNQVIDTKGNKSSTLNFPKVKTSAENKLIDFDDIGSLSSNSSASSFNPSSFSATLTESLASLQQAQQNSFKTLNLDADSATIGTLKITSTLDIASTVFQTPGNYPAASQTDVGFTQRAQQDWFNLNKTTADWTAQANRFISPKDLDDWANKNAFITTVPADWPLALADIPALASFTVNNAGNVTDTASLVISSNFNMTPLGSITDARWYDTTTTVTKLVLGSISNLSDYNGRSGAVYVTYPSEVKLGSILPENVWSPVDLNWRSIDDLTGQPVTYLKGTVFLVTYYISGGKMVYVTNVIS